MCKWWGKSATPLLIDPRWFHRRKQRMVDASKRPLADSTPAEGKFVDIGPCNIPPSMSDGGLFSGGAFAEITILDNENYRVAWETAGFMPKWLLFCERWQILTEVEGGKTKYESTEVFYGPIAYLVKLFVGAGLQKSFQAMADTLKAEAEAAA
mgnify:CR=1 FL=1